MNNQDRNRRIYEISRDHPEWTYRDIGELLGISPQRVHQIVRDYKKRDTIDIEMEPINDHHFKEPVSATQAARETGIPYFSIVNWARRGLVKVVQHPGHACTGKPVLLDPVTLQERVARYRPRPRRNRASG